MHAGSIITLGFYVFYELKCILRFIGVFFFIIIVAVLYCGSMITAKRSRVQTYMGSLFSSHSPKM